MIIYGLIWAHEQTQKHTHITHKITAHYRKVTIECVYDNAVDSFANIDPKSLDNTLITPRRKLLQIEDFHVKNSLNLRETSTVDATHLNTGQRNSFETFISVI